MMKKLGLLAVVFGLIVSCAKKEGCIDITATNYDTDAEEDDGSCKYETSVVITDSATAIKKAGLEAFKGEWIGVTDHGPHYISEKGDSIASSSDIETIILQENGKGISLFVREVQIIDSNGLEILIHKDTLLNQTFEDFTFQLYNGQDAIQHQPFYEGQFNGSERGLCQFTFNTKDFEVFSNDIDSIIMINMDISWNITTFIRQ